MSAVELSALVVVALGSILCIFCVALPYWRTNDPEDTVRDNIFRHEGLWLNCISYGTGNWDCDDFNRFFLGLPANLQAARGLGVASIAFSLFSILIMIFGMESIPCNEGNNQKSKRRIRIAAGFFALIGGALLLTAVSWYAHDLRTEHDLLTQTLRNFTRNPNRFVFGASLFVGWAGGFFLVAGSLLIFCTTCSSETSYDEFRASASHSYKPPKKSLSAHEEYI